MVCRYNHDPNMVLGTTAGGTLQLRTDNVGLDYEVLPPKSRADILELVERRDIQFSSFAFRVPPGGDEWGTTDQNYPMRTLHEVQLVDVAPVLDPAYPDATAGLRSLAAAMEAAARGGRGWPRPTSCAGSSSAPTGRRSAAEAEGHGRRGDDEADGEARATPSVRRAGNAATRIPAQLNTGRRQRNHPHGRHHTTHEKGPRRERGCKAPA